MQWSWRLPCAPRVLEPDRILRRRVVEGLRGGVLANLILVVARTVDPGAWLGISGGLFHCNVQLTERWRRP